MRGITNFDTRYGHKSYPVDALQLAILTTEAKNKRGTLCCVPKCNNFGGHKFPSEATAKNAWIKWLNEPEKRKLGCRLQFHAVGPRSSLPHAAKVQFRRLFPMSPAFRAIRGANLFRCEWVPYLSEYVCNIWLRSDGRVERKRGYRHTDSWHEWVPDNFNDGSATKRIVINEPSLLRKLFNKCILTCKLPRIWRRATVIARMNPRATGRFHYCAFHTRSWNASSTTASPPWSTHNYHRSKPDSALTGQLSTKWLN